MRVRRLGGDRAGEIRITRFLRNASVTPGEMVSEAARRTAERCQGHEVLVIQDTTVVRSQGGGGDYLHAVLALDASDGALLGLVDASFLQRSSGQKAQRKALPV
ncbi:MAG: transposase, partial [Hyphomonadaceae bacterium BRH_c29]